MAGLPYLHFWANCIARDKAGGGGNPRPHLKADAASARRAGAIECLDLGKSTFNFGLVAREGDAETHIRRIGPGDIAQPFPGAAGIVGKHA
jgi:hypothetical protein